IDVVQLHACCVEAVLNRDRRKTGPVLDAAEALFLAGGDEFAIDDDRRRRIGVVRVNAQYDHGPACASSSSIATSTPTILQQVRWSPTSRSISRRAVTRSKRSRAGSDMTMRPQTSRRAKSS